MYALYLSSVHYVQHLNLPSPIGSPIKDLNQVSSQTMMVHDLSSFSDITWFFVSHSVTDSDVISMLHIPGKLRSASEYSILVLYILDFSAL